MTTKWQSYEEAATYLLNQCASEFGLSKVEGKQSIPGLCSKTEWEIDAKGISEGNDGFIIIECRRYTTSKLNQEKIGSLAWRIIDTGAQGGIIISPLGLQIGAQKVVQATKIVSVQLSSDSTPNEFAMPEFLNKIFIGSQEQLGLHEKVSNRLDRKCSKCGQRFLVTKNEQVCSSCKQMNEFAFIIPVYNHAATVAQVVKDAQALCYPVFVVDDGSTDNTYDQIKEITGIQILPASAKSRERARPL